MQKIGQYSIIRELGSGQFGTVYMGIGDVPSRSFGSRRRRVVALKRLRDPQIDAQLSC